MALIASVTRKAERFVRDGHCRAAAPWFAMRRRDSAVARLRAFAVARQRPDWGRARSWLHVAGWTMSLVPLSVYAVMVRGRAARDDGADGRARQLLQILRLALRENLAPHAYYRFGLYRADRRATAADIIQLHELSTLLGWLNERGGFDDVDDKARFTALMESRSLPVVRTVAETINGAWRARVPPAHWPQDDLVLKPSREYGGHDVRLLPFDPVSRCWRVGSSLRDGPALLRGLNGADGDQVLQSRLRNDPQLVPLADQGVSTVRVVTHLEDGRAEALFAALRLPAPGSFVDNFIDGAMLAAIDLVDGTLGPAVRNARTAAPLDRHPVTGCRITGTILPGWPAPLDLAVRAHECIGHPAFLGWDIVITASGPVLLECNSSWSAEVWQVSRGEALGHTDFPARYLRALGRTGRTL